MDRNRAFATLATVLFSFGVSIMADVALGSELTDAIQARANWTRRWLEMSQSRQPTYTVDGNTYDLAGYARLCREQIAAANEIIAMLGGPIDDLSMVE